MFQIASSSSTTLINIVKCFFSKMSPFFFHVLWCLVDKASTHIVYVYLVYLRQRWRDSISAVAQAGSGLAPKNSESSRSMSNDAWVTVSRTRPRRTSRLNLSAICWRRGPWHVYNEVILIKRFTGCCAVLCCAANVLCGQTSTPVCVGLGTAERNRSYLPWRRNECWVCVCVCVGEGGMRIWLGPKRGAGVGWR